MLPTFIKFATSRRFVDDDRKKKNKPPCSADVVFSETAGRGGGAAAVAETGIAANAAGTGAGAAVKRVPSAGDCLLVLGAGSGHGHRRGDSVASASLVTFPSASSSPETKTVPSTDNESISIVSSISDHELSPASPAASGGPFLASSFRVEAWDKKTMYSSFVRNSLRYLKHGGGEGRGGGALDIEDVAVEDKNVVMLFESPSSASSDSTFFNCQVYKFHDWPPMSAPYKTMLGPCRYSMMNGDAYPSYLEAGSPPPGLMEHWESTVPGFVRPRFVPTIADDSSVYAYLPCESIANHVNDPHVHYHLAGKDALHLMTKRTTRLLTNTKSHRPCIAKVTHSMASKGIFVIANDEDEAEFEAFLAESGNPTFVVTEFVDIDRNVACHFFIHPTGEVTWFGSNENYREADGSWSMDSYLVSSDQDRLREMQLPFVRDVVEYCTALGFWGFCGIDVLFDKSGKGHLVDVNPRVTGSCPSLMVMQLLRDREGYDFGMFRRNGNITYRGPASRLLEEVAEYNAENAGGSKIVLFGLYEEHPLKTKINIAVYGSSLDQCRAVLNRFARSDL